MDFVLTDDEVALQHELRRFLSARSGRSPEVDRERWRELGALGVFDIVGSGLGWAGAVIVFEELGRFAVPGPLIPTALAASFVGGAADGAADGAAVVGFVEASRPALVEHLGDLDVLVVGRAGRLEVAAVPDASAVPEPLDPLTPVWRVDELPGGDDVGDLEGFAAAGGLLAAAFQVGLGQAAVDLGVGHAKQRRQFGRAIGAFQAVKHELADAAVAVEVARASVHAAAVTRDEGDSWSRARSAARVVASRAADQAARTCIQVHGGIGFTWELDAHLLLKRSWVLDTSFGGVDAAMTELSTHR